MSLTVIFIIINVAASFYAWQKPDIMNKWIFNPYSVNKYRQYYRFITSGFIHNDYLHLFFNMFVLWMFGRHIENIFLQMSSGAPTGYILYTALYLLAIIAADIPSYAKHKDHIYYNALGASGGVSAILFSYVLFDPTNKIYLYGLIGLPGVVWAVIYVLYSIYMGKKGGDNVNHDAHLWGGLFGIAFTLFAYPEVISHFINELKYLRLF